MSEQNSSLTVLTPEAIRQHVEECRALIKRAERLQAKAAAAVAIADRAVRRARELQRHRDRYLASVESSPRARPVRYDWGGR